MSLSIKWGIVRVIRTLESDKLGFNSGFLTFSHFFFFKDIYLFIFGCAGSSLLCGLFSIFREWGLLSACSTWAFHCGGFSCRARALGCLDFSRCSLWAHSCDAGAQLLCGRWDPLGAGIESVSPTLASGLSTLGPPRKPSGSVTFQLQSWGSYLGFWVSVFTLSVLKGKGRKVYSTSTIKYHATQVSCMCCLGAQWDADVIILVWHIRTVSLREVKWLVQGHPLNQS